MILHALRLWNIKSYGEGPDGGGVTVNFAPGINRIAGRNGHGKTTLIEALGYALFFAKPVFEENFDAATYLLRAGKKEGAIDVTFSHRGETYRVERGLGTQSRRRSKVVVPSDGSLAAEGDAEVAQFLCRLFGFADAGQLAEVFAKLTGVKQGRLTWPFDSKPSEAKKHFEPLLEVEIFRQCFDRLKPVIDEYESLRHVEETRLAAVAERLRERSDSAERVKTGEAQVQALDARLATARQALEAADHAKQRLEAGEKAVLEARRERDLAQHALALAAEKRASAAQQHAESTAAAATLAGTAADAVAFAETELALKQLHERQQERAALDRQLAAAITRRTDFAGKAAGAEELARTFASQRAAKAETAAALDAKSQQLASPDTAALEGAAREEKAAAEKLEAANGALTSAREARRTLATQLDEIAGGMCPFLKDRCRQFNPAQVTGDLRAKDRAIEELEKRLSAERAAHREARTRLDRLTVHEAQRASALAAQRTQSAELAAEMKALAEKAAAKLAEAAHWRGEMEATARTVAELADRLKPFATLEDELRTQQSRKVRHEPGHRQHLAARPLAGLATTRQQALEAARQSETSAIAAAQARESALQEVAKHFDPAALEAARRTFQEAHTQVATLTANAAHAKAELAREQKRLSEYTAALGQRAALERELAHLRAAADLTQKARTLLRDAAPYVAQHICSRIAAQAQQLFNRLSPEPVELTWDARHYSLRVDPGARRFAMLSGGEQTKLALAMTLAMIHDFSALGFCVFDEPTYGVDSESRDRLASAIVEAQAAAGFDQLLLVSHDDVFDGKIEHTVLLRKTAAGTQVESR
jgi:exonuclease SbcC